ncbi:MAG: glycerol-3-phosphate 1-O-acyltransferase PlsY [Angelakisella sp.]
MSFNILLAALMAYLLGSVSFGVIISKLGYKDDIRRHGSGNAGTTNALRTYGGTAAVLVFLGDFLKGSLAVFLGGLLCQGGEQIAAVMVVVGHLFPLFFGMRGGKGVATAAGAILVLSPLTLAILAVPFGVILAVTRYMSLAAVTVAALFPIVTGVLTLLNGGFSTADCWWELGFATLIGGLVVWMHRSNIKRLLNGTESKVGKSAKK